MQQMWICKEGVLGRCSTGVAEETSSTTEPQHMLVCRAAAGEGGLWVHSFTALDMCLGVCLGAQGGI